MVAADVPGVRQGVLDKLKLFNSIIASLQRLQNGLPPGLIGYYKSVSRTLGGD